jgi:hypothetical protein
MTPKPRATRKGFAIMSLTGACGSHQALKAPRGFVSPAHDGTEQPEARTRAAPSLCEDGDSDDPPHAMDWVTL